MLEYLQWPAHLLSLFKYKREGRMAKAKQAAPAATITCVHMRETAKVSPNGYDVTEFLAGKTYETSAELAENLIKGGLAAEGNPADIEDDDAEAEVPAD